MRGRATAGARRGWQARRSRPAPPTRSPRCWGRGDPGPPRAGPKPERSAPPLHPPPRPGPPPSLPFPAAPQSPAGDWKENWKKRAWRTYAQGFSGETFFSFRFSISSGARRVRGLLAPPGPRRGWECAGVGAGAQGWTENGGRLRGTLRTPGPDAPAAGTVGLVLFSAPPPTHPGSPRPAPSRSAYPRAFQSCHSRAKARTRRERQTRGQGSARKGASPESSASSQWVSLRKRRGPLLRCTTDQWWGRATPSEPVAICEMEGFRKSNWETAHIERKLGFTAGGIHSFRFLRLFLTGRSFQAIV